MKKQKKEDDTKTLLIGGTIGLLLFIGLVLLIIYG